MKPTVDLIQTGRPKKLISWGMSRVTKKNSCLSSLRWSEHALWVHSCLSTGHRCVTRQARAPPALFIYLCLQHAESSAYVRLWQWSTVTAVCGVLSLSLSVCEDRLISIRSARPLPSHCQTSAGLWCGGRLANESCFHQLSPKSEGGQETFLYRIYEEGKNKLK